jgi:hypothetical protein
MLIAIAQPYALLIAIAQPYTSEIQLHHWPTAVPYGPLYYRKTIAIAQPYAGKFQ